MGAATFCMLLATARQFFPPRWQRPALILGTVQFIVYAIAVLLVEDFRIVIVNYVPVMLLLLAMSIRGLKHGTGSWQMVVGILVLLAASAVQALGVNVFSPLDHDGLYHAISMVGVAVHVLGWAAPEGDLTRDATSSRARDGVLRDEIERPRLLPVFPVFQVQDGQRPDPACRRDPDPRESVVRLADRRWASAASIRRAPPPSPAAARCRLPDSRCRAAACRPGRRRCRPPACPPREPGGHPVRACRQATVARHLVGERDRPAGRHPPVGRQERRTPVAHDHHRAVAAAQGRDPPVQPTATPTFGPASRPRPRHGTSTR